MLTVSAAINLYDATFKHIHAYYAFTERCISSGAFKHIVVYVVFIS